MRIYINESITLVSRFLIVSLSDVRTGRQVAVGILSGAFSHQRAFPRLSRSPRFSIHLSMPSACLGLPHKRVVVRPRCTHRARRYPPLPFVLCLFRSFNFSVKLITIRTQFLMNTYSFDGGCRL